MPWQIAPQYICFYQKSWIKIYGKPPFVNEIKPSFVQELPKTRTAIFEYKNSQNVWPFFLISGIFTILQNENSQNFLEKST